MYELMGRGHAWLAQERGQGTVEYVGLIMLLAAVMAAVLIAGQKSSIATTIVDKLKGAIDGIG
jgi:Flp pilus assembly pilin Flp